MLSKVHMPVGISWDILDKSIKSEKLNFMRDNWEYLGSSEHVGGFELNNKHGRYYFGVFKCKLVTDDNKCSIHETKPETCSGYPWYNNNNNTKYINGSIPWPYKGCGFEKISGIMTLLNVICEIRRKKEDKDIEIEKNNSI